MRAGLTQGGPARDAALATAALLLAIAAGSGGFSRLDPALLGYFGATVVAVFGTAWRLSAAWRRPAAAVYVRALGNALRVPRQLRAALRHAHRDLVGQRFIAVRGRGRWLAHLLLSLGTLASFGVTLPLVWGLLHFRADGQHAYGVEVAGIPAGHFALDGLVAWLVFHALAAAGVAVALGAAWFLAHRWRTRAVHGSAEARAVMPLVLLLAVALTGLALPATHDWPAAFRTAAVLHEATVVLLLVALPFSKLSHLLLRPLQIGARLVRAADLPRVACARCGEPLAPTAQLAAVHGVLEARGLARPVACPSCRRRTVAAAQASLLGAGFQPRPGVRPVPGRQGEAA